MADSCRDSLDDADVDEMVGSWGDLLPFMIFCPVGD